VLTLGLAIGQALGEPHSWQTDWAVADDVVVDMDTEGFRLPSAIAFVPKPGTRPKDPLYFVTELRGAVKVVTNDRTVHTFAENFVVSRPVKELPDIEGETGLAGICLDPNTGYVFVTFAYTDATGVLRNNIVRFATDPHTFAIRPTAAVAFTALFAGYESVPSHQIGGCRVDRDTLFVSVADARETGQAQALDSLLGKVLRMTPDGRPVTSNPFYDRGNPARPAGFVWAYGLRNPFGLHVADGKVIVADNGSGVDRVLEAKRGVNYLWDGTDTSIATNAVAVITPSVGPVQVDYYRGGSEHLPPTYERSLFVAMSAPHVAGVMAIGYEPKTGTVLAPPRQIVRFVGPGRQVVVGVALGPDGLYFVPLMPDAGGRSAVFKVRRDPGRRHPIRIVENQPELLLAQRGCLGCHRLGAAGGTLGPSLDREPLSQRVRARVEAHGYTESLRALDRSESEPYRSYRAAREAVLNSSGERKLQTWVKYRIMEPRFDDAHAQMPNLKVPEVEAEILARYLLPVPETPTPLSLLARIVPAEPRRRHLVLFFGMGVLGGIALLLVIEGVRRRLTARQTS
jgi:glucose/arabinose dehydrogenase